MKKQLVFAILALALILSACGPAAGTLSSSKSIHPHQREIWIDRAAIIVSNAEGLTRVTVSVDADEIWVTPNYTINDETCVTKTACLFDFEVENLQIEVWKNGLYGGTLIGKNDFNKGISFYMFPRYNRFLTEQPVSSAFWRSPDRWQVRLDYVGHDEKGDFLMIVAGYPSLTQNIKVYPAQQKEKEQDGYLIRWFDEETGGIEGSHWWIQIWK